MSTQGRHTRIWLFTWNNYPEDVDESIKEAFEEGKIDHIAYQREVAPETQTPHLQGYLYLKKKAYITGVRKLLPLGIHYEPKVFGRDEDIIAYCCKESTRAPETEPVELGNYPVSTSGKRNDLLEFRNAVNKQLTWAELTDQHDKVISRYYAFARDYYITHANKAPHEEVEMEERPWHAYVDNYIQKPDNRTVLFIVDPKGGMGKTTYARNLQRHNEKVQYLKPEKEANIALHLDPRKSIFILDCPRSRLDIPLPYNTMESIKDGYVMSGKYQSCMKKIAIPNSVIVFTNEAPDPTRLSEDRWNVQCYNRITKNLLKCEPNATEGWDVMSNNGLTRLKTLTNSAVEKKRKKTQRENEDAEDREERRQRRRQT